MHRVLHLSHRNSILKSQRRMHGDKISSVRGILVPPRKKKKAITSVKKNVKCNTRKALLFFCDMQEMFCAERQTLSEKNDFIVRLES